MTQNANPIVSVVVTTYNRKDLLKETIDSILNQTYENFELIVVDNYSDYDFLSYIESFNDNRISAFQNQNNGIIAANRNIGIKKAKGEYIAFCDDDDYWELNKLDIQLKCFENNTIVGVGSNHFRLTGKVIQKPIQQYQKDKMLDFHALMMFNSVALSSLMIRNLGFLFEEKESLIAVEDFDFQLQLTKEIPKSILLLAEPLIFYRIDSTNKNSGITQARNVILVIKKYEDVISQNTVNKLFHLRYYFLAKMELNALLKKESRKHFRESLKYRTENNKNRNIIFGLILSHLPDFIIKYYCKFFLDIYN